MGEKAEPAIPHLIEALGDPDKTIKRDCGLALSRIGKASLPPLLKILENESTQIDAMAAISWHGSNAAAAVPKLREILKDADAAKRVQALETLAHLRSAAKDAIPDMIAALKDKDPLVRAMAAASFKFMGSEDKSIIAPLREALNDKDPIVRKMAKETLELIDPQKKTLVAPWRAHLPRFVLPRRDSPRVNPFAPSSESRVRKKNTWGRTEPSRFCSQSRTRV